MPVPIRPARVHDLDQLTAMAERFFAVTGYADFFRFSADATRRSLGGLVASDGAAVLVAERDGAVIGAAGALCVTPVFADEPVMQELFWWVEEAHRGTVGPVLFRALRRWAGERGARVMVMAAVDACDGERVGRLYRRMGFVSLERSYIAEV